MERRLLVVLSAVVVAVIAVGLSTAATMSRSEPVEPAKKPQAAKPAKKATAKTLQRNANEPATVSSGQGQSTQEVESYWTKERMEDAQPMENTRQGGSPSSSPAPSANTTPGSVPTSKPKPRRTSAKKPRSASDTGVSTSPAVTPNPGYWTDEALDGAQPMDKTRPGGSGSQESPDPGGGTVPGTPPP
jgi:hypothetical protein